MQYLRPDFHTGETMKNKYEHRPGLFGLASIAAGYAVKYRKERTKQKSTAAEVRRRMQSESRSLTVKKKENHSGDNGSGAGV